MKIGVVGLGKVGLVLAQVLRHVGEHEVIGYDVREAVEIRAELDKPLEPVPAGDLDIADSMRTLVLDSDVVYICVPTPTQDDNPSGDFDYKYLLEALNAVSQEASKQAKHITVVVLSTVAPGTFLEQLYDAVEREYVALAYSPSFISLGSIEHNMIRPTAILIGTDNSPGVADTIQSIWHFVNPGARRLVVSIESAEIIKMASNTLQFFKIQYINALAEMAEKTYADMDEVSDSLENVLNHGWIPRAGMPDGGACRPRDVAAMWAVADRNDLWSVEFFASLADTRMYQMQYISDQITHLGNQFRDLPILILGDSYKAGVTYTDGAAGGELFRLLRSWMPNKVSLVPGNFTREYRFYDKALYVIAVPYDVNLNMFPDGSVIYDVWGRAEPDPNRDITYIAPGRVYGL